MDLHAEGGIGRHHAVVKQAYRGHRHSWDVHVGESERAEDADDPEVDLGKLKLADYALDAVGGVFQRERRNHLLAL